MAKKGVYVWFFSALTFTALLHLVDAISALLFNNQIKLLQLYPLINGKLQELSPVTYLLGGSIATVILWGITCVIAFDSPVETFLNMLLSDAKKQSALENQVIEEKSELIDVMNETVLSSNLLVREMKDVLFNVRAEVKEVRPLKESIERLKNELTLIKKEISKFEELRYLKNVQLQG